MGLTTDRIQRHLDREIEAIENSDMTPQEQAREIRQLEQDARLEYEEERSRIVADDDF